MGHPYLPTAKSPQFYGSNAVETMITSCNILSDYKFRHFLSMNRPERSISPAAMSTSSLPIVSLPVNTTLHAIWRPEPDVRGTYGILSTCLSTIIIAIWTARHPDIRTPPLPWFKTQMESASTIIVFLFAPELLPMIAANEYRKARQLTEKMGEADGNLQVCSTCLSGEVTTDLSL